VYVCVRGREGVCVCECVCICVCVEVYVYISMCLSILFHPLILNRLLFSHNFLYYHYFTVSVY
jgi:hypothetical protein